MYRETLLNTLIKKYSLDNPSISRINTGGSSRKYFRIKDADNSYIYCEYNDVAELERFVKITGLLYENNLNIQKIIEYSFDEKFILLQDLGDYNVYEFLRSNSGAEKKKNIVDLYKNIIDLMIRMQISCAEGLNKIFPERKFDSAVYLWETDYFRKMVLEKYLSFSIEDEKYTAACSQISDQLSKITGFFIHRDFQSQNIILYNKKPYFIDYQTAFSGSNFYDAVSLLYDPYSYDKISDAFDFLFDYYKIEFLKRTNSKSDSFDKYFQLTAMQRLMQANAAYVKLGLIENKNFFAQFVDSTLLKIFKVIDSSECAPEYFKFIFGKLKKDGKIKCAE